MLSNNWNDTSSFAQPYASGDRDPRSAHAWYRVAIIAGKGLAFPWPADVAPTDFGTDGGAHNFLRFLEGGGGTVNYRGSMATFFYNRQAVGTYKCCATVYGAPASAYAFDIDFLNAGAAAAEHAGVPRHERGRLLAGDASGPVVDQQKSAWCRVPGAACLVPCRVPALGAGCWLGAQRVENVCMAGPFRPATAVARTSRTWTAPSAPWHSAGPVALTRARSTQQGTWHQAPRTAPGTWAPGIHHPPAPANSSAPHSPRLRKFCDDTFSSASTPPHAISLIPDICPRTGGNESAVANHTGLLCDRIDIPFTDPLVSRSSKSSWPPPSWPSVWPRSRNCSSYRLVRTVSRTTTMTLLLAEQKMENLPRANPDVSPSPPAALSANTPGYFEYLDRTWRIAWRRLHHAAPGAVYVRRWAIEPLAGSPGTPIVLKVSVIPWPPGNEAAR